MPLKAQMMVINRVAAFFLPSNTKKRIETLEKLKEERPELSDLIDARIPDLQRRLEYFKAGGCHKGCITF